MAIKNINDSNFLENIEKGISLVDFWASWCGPCQMFGPIFESVSNDVSNVKFFKFEIDDSMTSKRIPAKYGVRSIPSILAFKDGELIDSKSGFMDADSLKEWAESL